MLYTAKSSEWTYSPTEFSVMARVELDREERSLLGDMSRSSDTLPIDDFLLAWQAG